MKNNLLSNESVMTDQFTPDPVTIGVSSCLLGNSENFPDIPVEESGRLNDPKLRAHFIERVFLKSSCHRTKKRNSWIFLTFFIQFWDAGFHLQ